MTRPAGVMNGDSRTADKFVVRLPEDMRARITSRSRAEHRSMNSFIIRALRTALDSEEQSSVREEPLAAQLLEFKPQFAPGMPCRFDTHEGEVDKVGVIEEFFFGESGILCSQVTCSGGYAWKISYDSLKPY